MSRARFLVAGLGHNAPRAAPLTFAEATVRANSTARVCGDNQTQEIRQKSTLSGQSLAPKKIEETKCL
jgi:hypothetical protein